MRPTALLSGICTLLAIAVPTAFASKVTTFENKTFRPNAGVVTASDVSVSDEPGLPGSLSGSKAFSLVIPADANVRFSSESLTGVTVSGISGITAVSVSSELRSLRFVSASPIPSGANLTVSGIRIIAYGKYSPLRGFDLDVGSDGNIDAYDPNGVRVNEEYGLQDTLPPSDPVNATGTFASATVTLTATPPGDIDFESFSISFESASGNAVKTVSASALASAAFDLPIGTARVRVRSVDIRSNASIGTVLFPVASVSSGTLVPIFSEPPTASGTVQASSGSAQVTVPTPYVPSFKSVKLSALIAAMDRFVAGKTQTDPVAAMSARNELAKSFEAFYRTILASKRLALLPKIKVQAETLKSFLK